VLHEAALAALLGHAGDERAVEIGVLPWRAKLYFSN
jgi:hypothetical protein